MRTFVLHGFNSFGSGRKSTDRLTPLLERAGHDVREVNYGWYGPVRTLVCNSGVAAGLAAGVNWGDIGIGHSNGCAILYRACTKGAAFSRLILIAPALDRDIVFPPSVRQIYVWYSPSDAPLSIARMLPWVIWGQMGRCGYVGPDKRYVNINADEVLHTKVGHRGYFDHLPVFGPLVLEQVT